MTDVKLGQDEGIGALGFDADEIVFAVSAALRGHAREHHREALGYAHRLLNGLATIDEDEPGRSRSLSELRGLLATRDHAIHAARDSHQDLGRLRETFLDWDTQLQELRTETAVPEDPSRFVPILMFFEVLAARSLSEVRRITEEGDPPWISSVPTELR
jgi:hypothetical protein